MNQLRVGIIGFGGAGQAHRHYFSCIPGCAVTKVYDPKEGGRDRALKCEDVKVLDNLDDFWPEIDVVSVCSPDRTHAGYIVEALGRSLNVLCEKPLTDSVAGIRTILDAERSSTAILGVLHQMRFVPLNVELRALAASGSLGRIHFLEGYYVHDLRERAFVYDDWRETDDATPMVYAGCHFMDLLRWIAGDEITEVQAMSGHIAFPRYPGADTVLASMRFRSGALGQVVVALGSAGPQDHSIRVYGTERSVENNVVFKRPGKWERMVHRPMLLQRSVFRADRFELRRGLDQLRVNLPALCAHWLFRAVQKLSPEPNTEYGAAHYPLRLYEHGVACVEAIRDFITAVRSGGKPMCTGAEAAKTVLTCLAANESLRVGRTVPVLSLAEVWMEGAS